MPVRSSQGYREARTSYYDAEYAYKRETERMYAHRRERLFHELEPDRYPRGEDIRYMPETDAPYRGPDCYYPDEVVRGGRASLPAEPPEVHGYPDGRRSMIGGGYRDGREQYAAVDHRNGYGERRQDKGRPLYGEHHQQPPARRHRASSTEKESKSGSVMGDYSDVRGLPPTASKRLRGEDEPRPAERDRDREIATPQTRAHPLSPEQHRHPSPHRRYPSQHESPSQGERRQPECSKAPPQRSMTTAVPDTSKSPDGVKSPPEAEGESHAAKQSGGGEARATDESRRSEDKPPAGSSKAVNGSPKAPEPDEGLAGQPGTEDTKHDHANSQPPGDEAVEASPSRPDTDSLRTEIVAANSNPTSADATTGEVIRGDGSATGRGRSESQPSENTVKDFPEMVKDKSGFPRLCIPENPPIVPRRRPSKGNKRETLADIAHRIPVSVMRPYFNYPLRTAAEVSEARVKRVS